MAFVELMLRGSYPEVRLEAREVAKDPQYHKVEGLSLDEQRERALAQMKVQVANGFQLRAFPKHLGGMEDAGGNIAAFEELVTADPPVGLSVGVAATRGGDADVMELIEAADRDLPRPRRAAS